MACNHLKKEAKIKFDREKWVQQDGDSYPYRNAMLNDLIADKKLTVTKRNGIFNVLGKPIKVDTNYFFTE